MKKGMIKGKLIETYWNGYRNYNELIKYQIYVYVYGDDLEEVTITEDGKKKKMLKGRLYMRFESTDTI